jgi:hypothetical protein
MLLRQAHHFLSLVANGIIQTLDVRIMSQVFYHCAIADGQEQEKMFYHFLSLVASGIIQTLDVRIMSQVFYH